MPPITEEERSTFTNVAFPLYLMTKSIFSPESLQFFVLIVLSQNSPQINHYNHKIHEFYSFYITFLHNRGGEYGMSSQKLLAKRIFLCDSE